ncbi:twin-arginine translocation signal domain-containing protein [Stutzerimonas stutzeri]|uniref:twin-arginine translocation signal domain-containing protein n=1 Tax=Stutzerimonas stutzeri TaxID=316 RepID=UPI003C6FF588
MGRAREGARRSRRPVGWRWNGCWRVGGSVGRRQFLAQSTTGCGCAGTFPARPVPAR